jgi:hypothetical protein
MPSFTPDEQSRPALGIALTAVAMLSIPLVDGIAKYAGDSPLRDTRRRMPLSFRWRQPDKEPGSFPPNGAVSTYCGLSFSSQQ